MSTQAKKVWVALFVLSIVGIVSLVVAEILAAGSPELIAGRFPRLSGLIIVFLLTMLWSIYRLVDRDKNGRTPTLVARLLFATGVSGIFFITAFVFLFILCGISGVGFVEVHAMKIILVGLVIGWIITGLWLRE